MAAPGLPAAISLPVASKALLLTDSQMLAPHCYKDFVQNYGQQSYITILEMLSRTEEVEGQTYFHYESLGKLHPKVSVQTAVVAPAAGADVTVVATAADHAASGTQSPWRVGEVVRVSSSGVEGKVVSVNKTTPNAHSAVIRPEKTTQAFISQGSANLLAGELLEFKGVTEAGERSTAPDPMIGRERKITNTTTEIRDVWRQTDRSMIEKLIFEYNGQAYYKYKGMDETVRRFNNNKAFKLFMGDTADNLGALGGSVGTVGIIPRVRLDGQTQTYTPGSLSIADMHAVTRTLTFNGGAQEYHWLSDIWQRQEFDDELFQTYNGGAIIWNSVGGDKDIAIGYGFSSINIDGFAFHMRTEPIFSPEAVYGAAATVAAPEFRHFGLFVPQKQFNDPVRKVSGIPPLTIVTNKVPGFNNIHNWETGAYANENKNEVAELAVHWLTYCGVRQFAANQMVILESV